MRVWAILLLTFAAFAQSGEVRLSAETEFGQPVAVSALILQGNGGAFSHQGTDGSFAWDYRVPVGTPIVAARDGVVTSARQSSNIGGLDRPRFWNEGNSVTINHHDGTASFYHHLERGSLRVRVGDRVIRGELIGRSGDTGYAGSPHLHYTVVDTKTRRSVQSKFAHWHRNDGVPREGDNVRAAAEPAIAQARIDLYRGAWRAVDKAIEAESIDIAWRVLHDVDFRENERRYYYAALLLERRAKLRADLMDKLKEAIKDATPSDDELATWMRMCTTLDGARDKEIVVLAKALRRHAQSVPGDAAQRWVIAQSQTKSWTAGLRAIYASEFGLARKHLLKAARSKTAVQPHAQKALRAIIKNWNAKILVHATRTVREASLCQGIHRKRILEDAEQWLEQAKDLQELRKKAFPKAPRSIDEFQKLHDDAIANLKKNKG